VIFKEIIMSINISKEKRDILVNKIKEIKQYIASSPQDENTSKLLSYIADIEKDIKGKSMVLFLKNIKKQFKNKETQVIPVFLYS
jgi:adenine-specific DNA-methyltransferase